jgi:hypothetical protein
MSAVRKMNPRVLGSAELPEERSTDLCKEFLIVTVPSCLSRHRVDARGYGPNTLTVHEFIKLVVISALSLPGGLG